MRVHLESPSPAPQSAPQPAAATTEPAESGRFSRLLTGFSREVDRGEAMLRHASRGSLGSLDAAALIAVQAGIYRYTEVVELAGKVVDRASSGVRSVLQSGSQ